MENQKMDALVKVGTTNKKKYRFIFIYNANTLFNQVRLP
jgi:hypothetical protein